MTESPLVSIITPVYNGAVYLEELIQSVLQQDYPRIEHLVIDDGSVDQGATLGVLRKYPHLRFWSRENKGQYSTMNEGLLAASGELVCFISADDIVSPGAVRAVVEHLQIHPQLDGVFGMTTYIDQCGDNYPYLVPFRRVSIKFYPFFAHISHCSLYIKMLPLKRNELYFNPSLKFVGDYDWIININKKCLKISRIDRELSKVRIHTNQTSYKHNNASSAEAKAVLVEHGINKIIHYLLSTINVLLIRIWKLALVFKNKGLKGMLSLLVKMYVKQGDHA